MQTSVAQLFNETAAAAYEAFPHELEKLAVLLVPSSDTPVYVTPLIAGQLTKDTSAIKAAVKELANTMRDLDLGPAAAAKDYNLAGTQVNLIALDIDNAEGDFSSLYTKKMNILFILDHEIGHHIVRNAYPASSSASPSAKQLTESAADAYAMLRHIQRFGKNTDHAGSMGENRANGLALYGDIEHYTTGTIQKAIELSESMDISGLSLRETAKLAEKIAGECRLDDKTLEKIRTAFQPVNKIFETYEDEDAYVHFYRRLFLS